MKFTFTITQKDLDAAFDKVVQEAISQSNLKGFRKGKAPKDKVIASIGESKLQQQAVEVALPKSYMDEIKKRKLTPVSYPNISLKKGVWGEGFDFDAEIAEPPAITLGDYKKEIKGLLAADKIWTPDKEGGDEKKEISREEQIDKVLRKILDTVKIEIPELLVTREVNNRLSQLVDQVRTLGLKMDDYLASTNQTQETIRQQHEKGAKDSLSLEFVLMEIAKDLKIEASKSDIDSLLKNIGDKKTRDRMQKPEEISNLFMMITKQKVVEKLLQLAV